MCANWRLTVITVHFTHYWTPACSFTRLDQNLWVGDVNILWWQKELHAVEYVTAVHCQRSKTFLTWNIIAKTSKLLNSKLRDKIKMKELFASTHLSVVFDVFCFVSICFSCVKRLQQTGIVTVQTVSSSASVVMGTATKHRQKTVIA